MAGQVMEKPSSYKYIAANATTVVKSGPGILKRVVVTETAAGAISIYDYLSADANHIIAILKASIVEGTYDFNVACNTGITVVGAADSKFTVMYD